MKKIKAAFNLFLKKRLVPIIKRLLFIPLIALGLAVMIIYIISFSWFVTWIITGNSYIGEIFVFIADFIVNYGSSMNATELTCID
jgi:hypothetical protein